MVNYTSDLIRSLWWEASQFKRELDVKRGLVERCLALEQVCASVPFHSTSAHTY